MMVNTVLDLQKDRQHLWNLSIEWAKKVKHKICKFFPNGLRVVGLIVGRATSGAGMFYIFGLAQF